ncbi:PWI domain-containing protein [Colletotrichum somersetense]|nr:PWI domain-containing protein [Colletotrichum somersetense]
MATGVDAKLLKSTKFPPEFNQKVDMQKVNLQVMKKWIASKISDILGSEDDVVIELCFNLIEGSRYPDIKSLQIQLTGFLDKDTAPFCKDLWKLCLSAQTSPQGVPKELLEAKKLELIQEKMEADRIEIVANAVVAAVETPGVVGEIALPGAEASRPKRSRLVPWFCTRQLRPQRQAKWRPRIRASSSHHTLTFLDVCFFTISISKSERGAYQAAPLLLVSESFPWSQKTTPQQILRFRIIEEL